MQLPDHFVRSTGQLFGDEGILWLQLLPERLDNYCSRTGIRLGEPYSHRGAAYVALAELTDGNQAVLKIEFPVDAYRESAALRLFDGRATVQLIDAEPDAGLLLLERVEPGTPLSVAEDDDVQATVIIASIIRGLRRPVPQQHGFPTIDDWVANMKRRSPGLLRATPQFPQAWIQRALALYRQLITQPGEPFLLHGDLHHGNVLASSHGSWRVIDPKGVVGEAAWEPAAYLFNPWPELSTWNSLVAIEDRRIAMLSELLGLPAVRIRTCAVIWAVLSAFWMLEDFGSGWEYPLHAAAALDTLPA